VTNLNGELDLDFMLRFENLNDDIKVLGQKLDIEIELPHRNYSFRERKTYHEYYDEESREYVAQHWGREIQLLKYTFD